MKKLIIAGLVLVFILSLGLIAPMQLAHAGPMTVPGGWEINVVYCTNGFSVELVVPEFITAGVTHRARITSITPSANISSDIYSFFSPSGAGGFSIYRYYYWNTVQSIATPVTAKSARWEDATRVNANNTDNDIVLDCLVPPQQLSPAHKAHTTNHSPTFNWAVVTGADMYRIRVYNSDLSYDVKVRTIGNTATTYTWEEFLPTGQYLWRLRGRNTADTIWSNWSVRFTLFID
jgi:hypothetical protein